MSLRYEGERTQIIDESRCGRERERTCLIARSFDRQHRLDRLDIPDQELTVWCSRCRRTRASSKNADDCAFDWCATYSVDDSCVNRRRFDSDRGESWGEIDVLERLCRRRRSRAAIARG